MPVSVNDPVTKAALGLTAAAASTDGSRINSDVLQEAKSMLGALPATSGLPLVQPIISLLLSGETKLQNSGADPELLLSLLKEAVSKVTLNQLLDIVTLDEVLSGLSSGNELLQDICIRVIIKADPTDKRIENERLLETLILLLPVKSLSAVTCTCLETLIRSHSGVRRLIFGGSTRLIGILLQIKMTAIAWVMNIIEAASEFSDEITLDDQLYDFGLAIAERLNDSLLLFNIIEFYTKIVCNLKDTASISPLIKSRLRDIFCFYNSKGDNPEVEALFINELFNFFGALSFTHPALYREFDQEFKVTEQNSWMPIFIAKLSPKFISSYYPSIVEALVLNAVNLPVYLNLVNDEECYRALHLSSSNIMGLQTPQRLKLLVSIAKTSWGATDLLQNWPQVMHFLINEEIMEPEAWQLKMDVLQNLVEIQKDVLYQSIWKDRVLRTYGSQSSVITFPPPQAAVAI